jgi:probable DNA metabolism protein
VRSCLPLRSSSNCSDLGMSIYRVTLDRNDDLDLWLGAARPFLSADVPPDALIWQTREMANDLFASDLASPKPEARRAVRVPTQFHQLAGSVMLHSNPDRFALLYTLSWRLQRERGLFSDSADPLMRRLHILAKQVGRDIHKMRAFLRFREMDGRFVAWFEPDHHIVRANATFFLRRFASMNWSILTPELSLHWDGETLSEGPPACRSEAPQGDPLEDMWRTYYASIFNPARLKIGAMLKEMPKRYWKNMPEASLIGDLIAGAQARESRMIAAASATPALPTSLAALAREAASCTRCPIACNGTRTVFGEGPADASIMLVGEQPGDMEEQKGRVFVGPAGQLLDRALAQAQIDRRALYVTNAVKHFKFERLGKRRLHQNPSIAEIDHCRWWLDQERAMVRPAVVVMLGASAARGILGKTIKLAEYRGSTVDLGMDGIGIATVHPSSILRLPDEEHKKEAFDRLVQDLQRAVSLAGAV